MIKLDVYTNQEKRKNVVAAYLRMLPGVLPFPEEDIRCALEEIGKVERIHFLPDSRQIPLQRKRMKTDKYKSALAAGGIAEKDPEKRDALYAKQVIKEESRILFDFLYEDKRNDTNGNVNVRNLVSLLSAWPQELAERLGPCKVQKNNRILSEVFCYDRMISLHAAEVYSFIEAMGVSVCPYCNENYIFTSNGNSYKTRPELDHYYVKSIYPYLALNMKNLVPACHDCNHGKGDDSREHLYPYREGAEDEITFRTKPLESLNYLMGDPGAIRDFCIEEIISDQTSWEKRERIQNSENIFGWDERSNFHKAYILELFRQRYIFSEEYIDSILEHTGGLFHSREEIYDLLSLHSSDRSNWSMIPLSKLTDDMKTEIENLINEK